MTPDTAQMKCIIKLFSRDDIVISFIWFDTVLMLALRPGDIL